MSFLAEAWFVQRPVVYDISSKNWLYTAKYGPVVTRATRKTAVAERITSCPNASHSANGQHGEPVKTRRWRCTFQILLPGAGRHTRGNLRLGLSGLGIQLYFSIVSTSIPFTRHQVNKYVPEHSIIHKTDLSESTVRGRW